MKRVLTFLTLAVLAGCGRGGDATGLSHERFIDVIVDLRRAAEQTRGDTASYAMERDRILLDARVTEEELRAYVEAHGRDVHHMASVWETINARLAEAEEDTVAQ